MRASPILTSLILAMGLIGCTGGTPTPVAPASVSPGPGGSAAPSLAPVTAFQDEFDGTAVDESRWKLFPQSGLALLQDGRLELLNAGRAKNFPYLVTRDIIIPQTGSYHFELGYEVLAVAENGLNFCLDYVPPEAPGTTGLTTPFLQATAQGGDLQIKITTEAGQVTPLQVVGGFKPGMAHRLRVEFDGTDGYHVVFDDQVLKSFTSTRRPQKFWIGTFPVQDFKEAYWPRLAIDRVAVGELTGPREVSKDLSPSPVPAAKATQPAG